MLTQEYLKEALNYDPETGLFTWLERPLEHFTTDFGWKVSKGKSAGKVAGSKSKCSGYIEIRLDETLFLAHRLAFVWVTGDFPLNEVDHINGDRSDNKWANLRDVTSRENGRNKTLRKDNKSGVQGVHWYKAYGKWQVTIRGEGGSIHLGYFSKLEDAAAARADAELEYGYHKNHGRVT